MYRHSGGAYHAGMKSPPRALRVRFGRNLRRLRQARRLTQERLAARAEIDPKYLGAVERGQQNISLDRIEILARVLDVDAARLLQAEEARAEASLRRAVSDAADLLRRAGAGRRKLMLQLMENVAGYGGGTAKRG